MNQISVWIKVILPGRFNQTVNNGADLSTALRIGEQPVLPPHHKGFNAPLRPVVAYFQTPVL